MLHKLQGQEQPEPHKEESKLLQPGLTPGGSAQTFKGMLAYMKKFRPAIVIWENVQEVAKEQDNQGSDLDILKRQWAALLYGLQVIYTDTLLFGCPSSRKRLYIVAYHKESPLLTFAVRDINEVLGTLRLLMKVCVRQHDSAHHFQLEDSDPRVVKHLAQLQDTASKRSEKGYQQKMAQEYASKKNLKFPPDHPHILRASPWFQTLTMEQKDALAFNMAEFPAHVFFRDTRQSVGQIRMSALSDDNRHIARTCIPNQAWMAF